MDQSRPDKYYISNVWTNWFTGPASLVCNDQPKRENSCFYMCLDHSELGQAGWPNQFIILPVKLMFDVFHCDALQTNVTTHVK